MILAHLLIVPHPLGGLLMVFSDIPPELRGLHPHNPVNRVREGGTQLELSPRVRGISPRSPLPGPDGLSPVTTALVRGLADAARSW